MPRRLVVTLTLLAVAGGLAVRHQAFRTYPAEFVGRYAWTVDKPYFGGISGIDVSPDGARFLAIGDNAQVVEGTFTRANGVVTGMNHGPVGALADPDGTYLFRRGSDTLTDSEGVSWSADGSFYVSFERDHRVWRYAGAGAPAQPLPGNPDFADLRFNGSLEALASDEEGTLYIVPEYCDADPGCPLFRFREGAWSVPLHLPKPIGYRAVGADLGPDGALYLLERKVTLNGFQSRVRRIVLDGDRVAEDTVILETWPGERDNLEGLSAWRDGDGAIRLTMVADDNFQWWLDTEIVEYRLTD